MSAEVRVGRLKSWARRLNEYWVSRLGGRRWCRRWDMFEVIFAKSLSSASKHIFLSVGAAIDRNPAVADRLRKASRRSRSAAEVSWGGGCRRCVRQLRDGSGMENSVGMENSSTSWPADRRSTRLSAGHDVEECAVQTLTAHRLRTGYKKLVDVLSHR